MKSDKLTIMIQPEWASSTKKINSITSFTLPRRFLYYLTAGTLLFFIFGISGSWNIRENIAIRSKIASLNKELTLLRSIVIVVDDIRKEEKIIRESLGIEDFNKSFGNPQRLGIGGAEVQDAVDAVRPPVLHAEQQLETALDNKSLHIRVHDLREDIHELKLILSKRKETLKCRPTIMPVKNPAVWISSGYGWRKSPFTGLREFHKGLDICGKKGEPIIATADGVVLKKGYNRFIGNYVKIKHTDRFTTSYGHLWKHNVKKGDKVTRGQAIGLMGSTGMSTGYHVHYEVVDNGKKVNPYDFILNRNETSLASSHY